MSNAPGRVSWLGFRIDEGIKDLIKCAAHLSQNSLNDFCVTALADTARRTIAEHKILTLSDRDREAFFDALMSPSKPSERLTHALEDHRRRVAS